MRFINRPVVAVIMTLIVAQQWLSVGMHIHNGWTGKLTFSLVTAIIATVAVIVYHQSRNRAAYYDGRIDGIDNVLNPTCRRTNA